MYFTISQKAINHLKKAHPTMAAIIDQNAVPKRPCFKTLHEAFIDTIIAQQISTLVYKKIRTRFFKAFSTDLQELKTYSIESFQSVGLSFTKAHAIHTFLKGDYKSVDDLSLIKGVGPWTIKIIQLFYLQEANIFLIEDGGIQAALKKHFNITDKNDQLNLTKRFEPYGSVATLYLWESLVK